MHHNVEMPPYSAARRQTKRKRLKKALDEAI
jgi:hypothetical protein